MVLWWLIIGAAVIAAGGGIGFSYLGGRASAFKKVALTETATAGGSGILTGLFNLLFGDVGGILNKAIYWGVLVILIYLVIKLIINLSKRKRSKVKSR